MSHGQRWPAFSWKATRKSRGQLLISTHSGSLLADEGIAAGEVVLLRPTAEGTSVTAAADIAELRALLEGGMSVGEAVMPRVAPAHPEQLVLELPD